MEELWKEKLEIPQKMRSKVSGKNFFCKQWLMRFLSVKEKVTKIQKL